MRTTLHDPDSGFRIDRAVPVDWPAAALSALDAIRAIVSKQCVAHPDSLTRDGITAYALALMRLRECASGAGFERLMNACDALAVTVSRLIEDQNCARHDQCEALTRFVAHAQAMIRMSPGNPPRHPGLAPTLAAGRVNTQRNARVQKAGAAHASRIGGL
jgi:hypothetical protein